MNSGSAETETTQAVGHSWAVAMGSSADVLEKVFISAVLTRHLDIHLFHHYHYIHLR